MVGHFPSQTISTDTYADSSENCLPDNPYVQMLKENHGAECKLVGASVLIRPLSAESIVD